MNVREHWRARARRVKAEREATTWALKGHDLPDLPCVVTLTRVAPSSGLDDDNLRGACKAVRDAVAAWIGRDDRDPAIRWEYDQRRGKRGEWAVEVRMGAAA